MSKHFHTACVVAYGCDTDQYGTFSGEIERTDDPLTTLRRKCTDIMETFGYDLGIASEGSFGPHPLIPFAAANEEWILLVDKANGLEYSCRVISTQTNFAAAKVHNREELFAFAAKAGFPRHGLILRSAGDGVTEIVKGIQSKQALRDAYTKLSASNGCVSVETDMRAMMNPTRMKQIRKATHKLIHMLRRRCQTCGCPGLQVSNVKQGLPCRLCHRPTRSTLSYYLRCVSCGDVSEQKYPNRKRSEDPMYCDYCNP